MSTAAPRSSAKAAVFLLRTRASKMESFFARKDLRYFGDSAAAKSGRVLVEEERAAEKVYILKMEREKLEKLRRGGAFGGAAKDRVEAGKPGSLFGKEASSKKAQAEA